MFWGTGMALSMPLLYGAVQTGFSEEVLFRGIIAGSRSRRLPLLWGRDPHLHPRFPDASLDHEIGTETLAHFPDVNRHTFELEGRGPRNHVQSRNARGCVDDFITDPVAKNSPAPAPDSCSQTATRQSMHGESGC